MSLLDATIQDGFFKGLPFRAAMGVMLGVNTIEEARRAYGVKTCKTKPRRK